MSKHKIEVLTVEVVQFWNFRSRSSITINIFIISVFNLFWLPNFKKSGAFSFGLKCAQALNFDPRSAVSKIIFMINELELLWALNFIALGIFFIFENKFSWNEEIDTCFNVECVFLDEILIFLVITACYRSLLLLPTFSMNEKILLSSFF